MGHKKDETYGLTLKIVLFMFTARRARGGLRSGGYLFLVVSFLWLAPVEFIAADLDTAWQEAIRKGDLVTLTELASPNLDVNLSGPKGKTALMVAASQGDVALMHRLLELEADVDQRNRGGGTALMYAAQYGQKEAAGILLANDATADIQGGKGWTAMMIAVLKGREAVTELLLEQGADPNVRDMHGWTPLMRAVADQRTRTVEILLTSERIDVNASDPGGLSALHVAAALGDISLTRRLLAHGADTQARDGEGNTPLMLAEQAQHSAVSELLKQHTSLEPTE